MQVQEIEFVKGVVDWEGLPDEGLPEIAFMGRSNVGKSSLINLFFGRRKPVARISAQPGKTRELNFYRLDSKLFVVDLPGFGYAKVSRTLRWKWQQLIDRYLAERSELRCVFHLIDSRHPPTAIDLEVMRRMRALTVPYIAVLTKSDKISRSKHDACMKRAVAALHNEGLDVPVLLTSSEKGEGRKELWMLVEESGALDAPKDGLWVREGADAEVEGVDEAME
jgi:GTP-binding protein